MPRGASNGFSNASAYSVVTLLCITRDGGSKLLRRRSLSCRGSIDGNNCSVARTQLSASLLLLLSSYLANVGEAVRKRFARRGISDLRGAGTWHEKDLASTIPATKACLQGLIQQTAEGLQGLPSSKVGE